MYRCAALAGGAPESSPMWWVSLSPRVAPAKSSLLGSNAVAVVQAVRLPSLMFTVAR